MPVYMCVRMVRKVVILSIAVLVYSSSCFSQDFFQSTWKSPELSFEIFSSDRDLSAGEIIGAAFEKTDQAELRLKYHWVKISFDAYKALLERESKWFIQTSLYAHHSSMYFRQDSTISSRPFGFIANDREDKINFTDSYATFSPDELIDQRYLVLKFISPKNYSATRSVQMRLYPASQIRFNQKFKTTKDVNERLPFFIFTGFCLLLFICSLAVFIYEKRREFLYYSLYILTLGYYLNARPLGLEFTLFGNSAIAPLIIDSEVQILYNLFYLLFAIHFLRIRKMYPRLYKPIILTVYVYAAAMVIHTVFMLLEVNNILSPFYGDTLLDSIRVLMSLVGIALIVYLLRNAKNKLAYFMVAGSLFFSIGAYLTWFGHLRIYMVYGSSAEVLTFVLGLGYKYKMIVDKKIEIQKEAATLRLSALKAQMNPHFIFNSLNSIQHFILKQDSDNALIYLSKFSKLLRRVLDDAIEHKISFADEIELLKAYLSLEQLRFDNHFEYSIIVDPALDIHNEEVPVLLIQPYVENAIVHGLLPSGNSEKKLTISFKDHTAWICCTIEDNGVGFYTSQSNKSGQSHKSQGTHIVRRRLEHLSHSSVSDLIKIEEKRSEDQTTTGTIVRINIPKTLI